MDNGNDKEQLNHVTVQKGNTMAGYFYVCVHCGSRFGRIAMTYEACPNRTPDE